jgi:uncharacterized membrane protein YeiH
VNASTASLVLELVGIFAFALSGASLAVERDFDLVGMAVLAETTALGGGVLRDVILGTTPAAFSQPAYLVTPLLATAVVFVWHRRLERVARFVLVVDAAGVGLFCVVGTQKALMFGLAGLPAVILGATSAVGGGVLRDLLARQDPTVLRKDSQMYAIPALLGATIVALGQWAQIRTPALAVGAAVIAFALRMLALRYNWRAPHPRR